MYNDITQKGLIKNILSVILLCLIMITDTLFSLNTNVTFCKHTPTDTIEYSLILNIHV